MRKTNLLKGVVCGLLFTAVAGSAVFAGTDKDEKYIGNKNDFITKSSNAGRYTAFAREEGFSMDAVSKASNSRKFYIVATYRGWKDDTIKRIATNTKILKNSQTVKCSVYRDKTDVFSECHGRAVTWYGEQDYTGICDDYTMILNQRWD